MTDRTAALPDAAQRAANLFAYLEAFTQLRSAVTRDVASYESHLFAGELAGAAGCGGPLMEQDAILPWSDPWLTVERPRAATMPPPLPGFLAGYSLPEAQNPAWTPPVDLPPFEAGPGEPAPDPADPAVIAAWREWATAWTTWASRELPHHRARLAYQRLFQMRTRQERMGEQFELIAGLGLLSWDTPAGQRVRRHLIAVPAALAFEDDTGTLTLSPVSTGKPVALEMEMLEFDQRPADTDAQAIEASLAAAGEADDLAPILLSSLRRWVTQSSVDGEFDPGLAPPTPGETPVVSWAPAIVLRRRGERTLQKQFGTIAERLREGGDIPPGILRLITIMDDQQPGDATGRSGERRDAVTPGDNELYFPLPANDEQRQIAERLRVRQGVLVQGPPGTGKSHTIANLLCHLLATGNRVLVTSHTARALSVLHDKLPPEIAALCVSVMGADHASARHLESVVRGITQRQERWGSEGDAENLAEIESLTSILDQVRREQARRVSAIREQRRKAAEQAHPPIPGYRGTPTEIGLQVSEQTAEHAWLQDRIVPAAEPPARDAVLALLDALRRGEDAPPPGEGPISPDDLPSPDAVAIAIADEANAAARWDSLRSAAGDSAFATLRALPYSRREETADLLDALAPRLKDLEREGRPWMSVALDDLLHRRAAPWTRLAGATDDLLMALSENWNPPEITGLGNRGVAEALADARELKLHIDTGGALGGFGPFRPEPVRKGGYLLDKARLGGAPCGTSETLGKLILALETRRRFDETQKLWSGHERLEGATYPMRRSALATCRASLQRVFDADAIAQKVRDLPGLEQLPLDALATAAGLAALQRTLAAAQAESELEWRAAELAEPIRSLAAAADVPGAYPAYVDALAALERRDPEAYRDAHASIAAAAEVAAEREQAAETLRYLATTAPRLAAELRKTPWDPVWDNRLGTLTQAWNRARAQAWLARLPGTNEQADRDEIHRLDGEIETTLARLAAAHAWRHSLSTMGEEERQHLIAWQAAITRAGRGTGKYAAAHLRDAREHLDGCRRAIPAWIMPLYRVAETMPAEPELFDVAIIDEASQSGPEALLLAYLARKLVVVGDDKQISPSNIGIVGDDVFALQRAHLQGIPQADALGLNSSFFDIASILFAGRITLREHFRSMPEIIEFSNRAFYRDTPLIPLRQYGQDRLDPIRTLHVPDGYEKGDVNIPEAEAIIDLLLRCIADPAYAGKSMGVISLKGEAQAKIIESRLLAKLDPREIEHRRIICGDAYAFQGDERDVMFLSMVKAPRTDDRTLSTIRDNASRRRFNVAASRARDQQWLVHSVALDDFSSPDDLRRMLLAYCLDPNAPTGTGTGEDLGEFDSRFEQAVCGRIRERGYRVLPQVRVGQFRIDLVVEGRTRRLAIECDGDRWHGPDRFAQDMARQRALERCGWTFWRVRGSAFYADPDAALAPLWPLLDQLGISPPKDEAGDTIAHGERSRIDPDSKEPRANVVDAEIPPAVTRFCTQCGERLGPDARYCGACGARITVPATETC